MKSDGEVFTEEAEPFFDNSKNLFDGIAIGQVRGKKQNCVPIFFHVHCIFVKSKIAINLKFQI